jgi:alkanesulfonate monooxygenase SsuD/methylene tetrahydromethanopterin reductase-like flavin-dependent oxidoreductase (luciferase family)
VKMALSRKKLSYQGEHYTLPLPDGPGKSIQLTVHGAREEIPVYLAAVGPKNLELAGEKADGWLAIFFSPQYAPEQLAHVSAGREKVGKTLDGFDVVATVPVVTGADDSPEALARYAEPVRAYASLYIGGMGSREKNFYNQLASRMGYEAEAAEVQDLFLAKKYREAAAAVPQEFIEATSLLGSVDRIAEGLREYAAAGVTTLSVASYAGALDDRVASLRTVVEALEKSGVGE